MGLTFTSNSSFSNLLTSSVGHHICRAQTHLLTFFSLTSEVDSSSFGWVFDVYEKLLFWWINFNPSVPLTVAFSGWLKRDR